MKEKLTMSMAIKKIAWGYVVIHCAINIDAMDALPDWLGYYFMFVAIRRIRTEEESVGLLEPFAKILIVWEALEWGTKIFGWDLGTFPFAIVINIVNIYFSFQLLTNLANVAERYGSDKTKSILFLRTVETVLNTILVIMVYLELANGWLIAAGIAGFFAVILICAELFTFSKDLEARNEVAV